MPLRRSHLLVAPWLGAAACTGSTTAQPASTVVAIAPAAGTPMHPRSAVAAMLPYDDVDAGGSGLQLSYPMFHHPDAAANAALAAIVATGLPQKGQQCGDYSVAVTTANTALVSVVRTSMIYPCEDPQRDALAARGMGGAPAGPILEASVYAIDGASVRPLSFGDVTTSPTRAGAALKQYCEGLLAHPDRDGELRLGICDSCDEIEIPGRWTMALTDHALMIYRGSTSSCRIVVPYEVAAPWLSPRSLRAWSAVPTDSGPK